MSSNGASVSYASWSVWLLVVVIGGVAFAAIRAWRNPDQPTRGPRGLVFGIGLVLLVVMSVAFLLRRFQPTSSTDVIVFDSSPGSSERRPNFPNGWERQPWIPTPESGFNAPRLSDTRGTPQPKAQSQGRAPQLPQPPVPNRTDTSSSITLALPLESNSTVTMTFHRGKQVRTSDKPPAWSNSSPDQSAQPSVRQSISSQWFATLDEAMDQAQTRTWEVVRQSFQDRLNIELPTSPPANVLSDNSIVADFQVERVLKDFGSDLKEPMFRAHAKLNFNATPASPIYQQRLAQVRSAKQLRLGIAVIYATLSLGFFGQYLRWKHPTQRRYRILALVAVVIANTAAGAILMA